MHLFSKRARFAGKGHLIDLTDLDLTKATDWLDYHGVKVVRGKAIVYKAVDQEFYAGQGYTLTEYALGKKVAAPDWQATAKCGHGLHFSFRPAEAGCYFNGSGVPRYLAVQVDVKDLIALGDKCKAPSGKVLFEVDVHGDAVAVPAVKA